MKKRRRYEPRSRFVNFFSLLLTSPSPSAVSRGRTSHKFQKIVCVGSIRKKIIRKKIIIRKKMGKRKGGRLLRRAFVSLSVTVLVFPSSDQVSLSLPFSLPQMSTSGFVARGGPASSSSSSTSLMQQPLLRNRHGSSRRAAADARSSMRTTNRVAAFAAAAAPLNPAASAGVVACSLVSVPGPRGQARREAAVAKVQQRKVRKRVFFQAKVRLPRKKKKTAIEKTKTLALACSLARTRRPLPNLQPFFSLVLFYRRPLSIPRSPPPPRPSSPPRQKQNLPSPLGQQKNLTLPRTTKTRPSPRPGCSRSRLTRPRPEGRPSPRPWGSPPSSAPLCTP